MHKYGRPLLSLSPQTLWGALYIYLIGPYTLKGKYGTETDFMCLTMIDSDSSWFETVELLITIDAVIPMDTEGQRDTKTHKNTNLPSFNNSSTMSSSLVNKT